MLRKSTLTTLLKLALAGGILAYLIRVVDFRLIVETARQADPLWIAAAVFLLPVNLFIEGTLWYRITRLTPIRAPLRTAFGALLSGYAVGFFTPGRIGELAGRSFYYGQGNKWELSMLVMYQRMIDMLVGVTAGLIAMLSFMYVWRPEPMSIWWIFVAIGAASILLLGFVLLMPRPAYRVLDRWIKRPKVLAPVEFLRRVENRHVGPYVALSTTRYFVFVSQFVFLMFAFSGTAPPEQIYTGASMTFYAKYLIPSITLMDLGIREGSAVFFMGQAGFPEAAAFNASLMMFFINLVVPSTAGAPFVFRLKLRKEGVEERDTAASSA